MNIEFVSLFPIVEEYFAIAPEIAAALITAGSAVASGVIGGVGSKKRQERESQQRVQEMVLKNKLDRENARQADNDKVTSMKIAGLSPNLAYGEASPVSAQLNPAETENSFAPLADSLTSAGSTIAPIVAQSDNLHAQTDASRASAELATAQKDKVQEEAEAQRLANEEKRGGNEASRFKLSALGLYPSALPVEQSTGYLRSIDFADEFHARGAERKLRFIASKLDADLKSKIDTDPEFKRLYQDAYLTQLDNYFEITRGNVLSNKLKSQDISLYDLRRESMFLANQKGTQEIENLRLNSDKLEADIQIAKENSWLTIFQNVADAKRRGDAKECAYWNNIGSIKSGSYDSIIKKVLFDATTADSSDLKSHQQEIDRVTKELTETYERKLKVALDAQRERIRQDNRYYRERELSPEPRFMKSPRFKYKKKH